MPKVFCGFCQQERPSRVSRVTGKLYCAICGRFCVTEICPTKRAADLATPSDNATVLHNKKRGKRKGSA